MSYIHYETRIRRTFFRDISKESVGNRIRDLEHEKKALKDLRYGIKESLGICDNRIQELNNLIDEELKLMKFYLGYFKEQAQPDFNKWAFKAGYKKNDWSEPCDAWIRSNGRIKIFVKIRKGASSVKVWLEIENSNSYLSFYEKDNTEQFATSLRKAESVDKYTNELKEKADGIFRDYQYPQYCQEQMQFNEVNTLLHIS